MRLLTLFCGIYLLAVSCVESKKQEDKIYDGTQRQEAIILTDENYKDFDFSEGEWIIKFYAPWCSACNAFRNVWTDFTHYQAGNNFKCAEVDISENPEITGRFLVTSLPSLFHILNGNVRFLELPDKKDVDVNMLVDISLEKNYRHFRPTSWLFHPLTYHMAGVGKFFGFAFEIRKTYDLLTVKYSWPIWAVYLFGSSVVVAIGLVLGISCVCFCEYCCAEPLPEHYINRNKPPAEKPEEKPVAASESQSSGENKDLRKRVKQEK